MFTIQIACVTSDQNREHDIFIPLDCFVVNDYFLSNCDDRIKVALVGQGPVLAAPRLRDYSNISYWIYSR